MDTFSLGKDEKNGELNVTVRADLCAENCPELRESLKNQLSSSEVLSKVVIDITSVNFIDSAGVGLLIALHNSLEKRDGRLVLTGVCESVFDFLTTLRLHAHFEICLADNSKE
ncbi:hypothetical protein CHISP_1131 [Chitinispirillum alkaliphilum]|nr:hypothetical protein CHISP_1131 [Chitinispirillum alkaliphilum]